MCGDDGAPSGKSDAPSYLKPTPLGSARNGDLVVEEFPVTYGGHTYPHGRIAYIKGSAPVPVILVHHNYAGMKQFDIDQACFLARAGYVGLATDLYKERDGYAYADRTPTEDDTEEQRKKCFHGAFDSMNALLRDPKSWRGLMAEYLELAFAHPAVANGRAGAIGYCLGGQSCLEQLRGGQKVQVLVTLHGLLHSRPMYKDDCYNSMRRLTKEDYAKEVDVPPTSCTPGCVLIVENGGWDHEVPAETIGEFMQEMDASQVDWRFNFHARTPHGWALAPSCPGGGAMYREVADRRSTKSMLAAFAEVWPDVEQHPVEANACGTKLGKQSAAPRGGLGSSAALVAAGLLVGVAAVLLGLQGM